MVRSIKFASLKFEFFTGVSITFSSLSIPHRLPRVHYRFRLLMGIGRIGTSTDLGFGPSRTPPLESIGKSLSTPVVLYIGDDFDDDFNLVLVKSMGGSFVFRVLTLGV